MIDQTLVNVIVSAYNGGLLQYDSMSICGITVNMKMATRFNTLTMEFCGLLRLVHIYNDDSDFCVETTISNLLCDIMHTANRK